MSASGLVIEVLVMFRGGTEGQPEEDHAYMGSVFSRKGPKAHRKLRAARMRRGFVCAAVGTAVGCTGRRCGGLAL